MKIEKKKVTGKAKLTTAVKGSIAAALGMASTFSLSACLGQSESGDPMGPIETPEPTCGETACDPQSSSSSVLDIPKSQERLSSSAIEALSSAAKVSSSSIEPPLVAGVPLISSPSSSESSSSSSVAPLSSSSETQSSSSTLYERHITPPSQCDSNDPSCFNIHICKDGHGCDILSMVTTFEKDDVQA